MNDACGKKLALTDFFSPFSFFTNLHRNSLNWPTRIQTCAVFLKMPPPTHMHHISSCPFYMEWNFSQSRNKTVMTFIITFPVPLQPSPPLAQIDCRLPALHSSALQSTRTIFSSGLSHGMRGECWHHSLTWYQLPFSNWVPQQNLLWLLWMDSTVILEDKQAKHVLETVRARSAWIDLSVGFQTYKWMLEACFSIDVCIHVQ